MNLEQVAPVGKQPTSNCLPLVTKSTLTLPSHNNLTDTKYKTKTTSKEDGNDEPEVANKVSSTPVIAENKLENLDEVVESRPC